MKRRNYTREILSQIKDGSRVAVNSLGPELPVTYSPRSKSDPQPWDNGTFRYSGRYVHTVPVCGLKVLVFRTGRFATCIRPEGHGGKCLPSA